MAHTPTPICLGRTESRDYAGMKRHEVPIHVGEESNRGNCVACVYLGGNGGIDGSKEAVEEFARLIVRAVNAFEPMREALKNICDYIDNEGPCAKEWEAISEWCEKGRTALALADKDVRP